MAVVNRTLDTTEQYKVINAKAGLTGTGVTGIIGMVPWPATIAAGQIAAFGLSGAPTYQLTVQRFITGTGYTVITVGSANVMPAFGTSGILATGLSLPAAGSTLLNVLPGDIVGYLTGVANTAVTAFDLEVVLKPIQDVKKHFNLV